MVLIGFLPSEMTHFDFEVISVVARGTTNMGRKPTWGYGFNRHPRPLGCPMDMQLVPSVPINRHRATQKPPEARRRTFGTKVDRMTLESEDATALILGVLGAD